MGYLNKKIAYLCGPIASVADDGTSWRNSITPILQNKYGIEVDDPCKKNMHGVGEVGVDKKYFESLITDKKFGKLKDEFYKIVRKDLRSVDRSDILILNHDPLIPTVGTIHELVVASSQKKPILMKYEKRMNPWIVTFLKENWIFESWEEMWGYLDKIDTGHLDTSHWW